MSKKCLENGIIYIKGLVNMQTKELINYNEFEQKHGKVLNFLQYYGILKAIPQKFKDTVRMNAYDPNLYTESEYMSLIEKDVDSKY